VREDRLLDGTRAAGAALMEALHAAQARSVCGPVRLGPGPVGGRLLGPRLVGAVGLGPGPIGARSDWGPVRLAWSDLGPVCARPDLRAPPGAPGKPPSSVAYARTRARHAHTRTQTRARAHKHKHERARALYTRHARARTNTHTHTPHKHTRYTRFPQLVSNVRGRGTFCAFDLPSPPIQASE
jgi:hypothetical protein